MPTSTGGPLVNAEALPLPSAPHGTIDNVVNTLATWAELDAVIVSIRNKVQRILDEQRDGSSTEQQLERVVELLTRAGRVAKRIQAWGDRRPDMYAVGGEGVYNMPASRLHKRLEEQAHQAMGERARV